MLQLALAQKDPSITEQCPPIQAVGEQDLFRKTSYEEYVPASFATITDLDWKELRGKCVEDMCTVLANLDQQLWEVSRHGT